MVWLLTRCFEASSDFQGSPLVDREADKLPLVVMDSPEPLVPADGHGRLSLLSLCLMLCLMLIPVTPL